jgi:hypothetical protein
MGLFSQFCVRALRGRPFDGEVIVVRGRRRGYGGKVRERQRAAAESSLTDRINLSVAEAFVNGGSLTSVEPIDSSRPAQILSRWRLRKFAQVAPDTRAVLSWRRDFFAEGDPQERSAHQFPIPL